MNIPKLALFFTHLKAFPVILAISISDSIISKLQRFSCWSRERDFDVQSIPNQGPLSSTTIRQCNGIAFDEIIVDFLNFYNKKVIK